MFGFKKILNKLKFPEKKGLPHKSNINIIKQICKTNYNSSILKTSYQNISGWKPTGACRIFIHLQNGKKISIIYKHDDFTKENIPALEGFPIVPGKIEYLLYSSPSSPINIFLPLVYYTKKLDTHNYQYYLEDLNRNYQNFGYKEFVSIFLAAKTIKKINQYLNDWRKKKKINEFPKYDKEFKKLVVSYALQNFKLYNLKNQIESFKTLLNEWDEISDLYINYVKDDDEKLTPIHGDYNISNLWLDKDKGKSLKAVDWEWSGIGLPQADLASLLVGQPRHVEKEALLNFSKNHKEFTLSENQEYYKYSKLERAILDCSYVSGICLQSKGKTRFNLNKFAIDASSRILKTYSEIK